MCVGSCIACGGDVLMTHSTWNGLVIRHHEIDFAWIEFEDPSGCDKTQNKGFLSCAPFWGPFMKIFDFGQNSCKLSFSIRKISNYKKCYGLLKYVRSVYGNYHYFFINLTILFEIFEKSQKFHRIWDIQISRDFGSFLATLKIAIQKILIFLAQKFCTHEIHMQF